MPKLNKLQEKLAKVENPHATREPLWKGPEIDGVTQSLLSRFLCCRERFRIAVIEGLRPNETWNHKIGYGDMWHVCEEAIASERRHFGEYVGTTLWEDELKEHVQREVKEYPLQQHEIDKWYHVCKVQFPEYLKYWEKHQDVTTRAPLLQEQVFKVPYKLPSGRTVFLRGKWDSVDFVGDPSNHGIWLQENKTKGDVRPIKLQRQLKFDLQTMLYLVALEQYARDHALRDKARELGAGPKVAIRGIRYNVIRRPLSGGKGSIVQRKGSKNVPPETKEEYYARLAQYIVDEPQEYFFRWNIEISKRDIDIFRVQFLDPILEQLCDWWEFIERCPEHDPFRAENLTGIHWRHPFGVYNVLDEGGSTDLDEYLETGSMVGLQRIKTLFGELE